ncbi:MAG TPA: hypothetical protein EYQ68_07460 [Cytophagales bacterium]|nr:hypothetical protein [Cytophagales bacterium]
MIEHLSEGLPVLVIVPGGILLGQWEQEILRFDPDAEILLASGTHNWRADLGYFLEESPQPENRRVVIAVDETAKTPDFLNRVGGLDSALVIIDECHNIGAPGYTGVWEWNPNKILGLSATPERMDSGTSQVFSLCGEIVHEYGIKQAIKDGYLSKYHYYIQRVSLTKDESDTYDDQMDVVSRLLAMHRNSEGTIDWKSLPKHVQLKIFEAKKIIKKAVNKIEKCAEIVEEHFVDDGSQRWLIYCQDSDQMSKVKTALQQRDISPIYEYWSKADGAIIDGVKQRFQPEETLEMWTSTGGVLLSIKCLDEGVSIDEISHGIILASSKNPREFIQRRGRLLRLSENKTHAEIWDALVIPDSSTRHSDFVLDEINRALEFSDMADGDEAKIELTKIVNELGLTGIVFGTED